MIHEKNLINKWTLILSAALVLSGCAATKIRIEKTSLDQYLRNSSVFKGSHSGLLVYDPENKSVVFEYNKDKKFIPASNIKLLTYYSMRSMLGDSIPGMNYCVVNDTLFFKGIGDPTFLYHPFEVQSTPGLLGNYPGTIVYIDREIEDERFGPGWAWDDYPYYFSVEKSTFPIYGNRIWFERQVGEDHITITPDQFEANVSVMYDSAENGPRIIREERTNIFTVRFSGSTGTINDEVPFIYSGDLFLELLSDTLHRQVLHRTQAPDCRWQTHFSVPTDSVSKYILLNSDNFLSEQMLLVISSQLGDTLSTKACIDYMLSNDLEEIKSEINWVDGSGLSRYNLVSPWAMVHVLDKIRQTVPKEKLYQLLPESGNSGTIRSSFTNLNGRIHAKTGSMSNVYNLSGFLETKSGKTLIFSFMNNNYLGNTSSLKNAMEQVLSVFYSKY